VTRSWIVAVLALTAACHAGRGARRGEKPFDGDRAFGYVQQQMTFGPRIPGTAGHDRAGDWIAAQLRATADTLEVQSFVHTTHHGESLKLRNFLARFRPAQAERILLLAHWDTRPHADQSQNPADRKRPVPGANDGGSGVAVLLGVADALKATPPAVGVDLLFVDGEDYGDFADTNDVLIGSRYFAAHQPPGHPPLFAVLLDMVGDRDLEIYYEGNSEATAPEVVERVWQTAQSLGYERYFRPGVKHTLIDDHVSLQRAGIHAIDVVDFDYPYWHTPEDTIDKVAAASLKIVGDVAVALVR